MSATCAKACGRTGLPAVRQSRAKLPNLEVVGLGCNLACYGGVIPTVENMQMLVDVRDACRKATGLELPVLSGGNSANLPLLASGTMPQGDQPFPHR